MKILIFSDTHGDPKKISKAITKHPDAEIIVHCGDGEQQASQIKLQYPDKMVIRVRGNCDLGSSLPEEEYFTVFGKKIMITHGHNYGVKYGKATLRQEAVRQGIDIVFFGHTHVEYNEYENGVYLFNPGHCSGWQATYGVAEITESGSILLNHAKV